MKLPVQVGFQTNCKVFALQKAVWGQNKKHTGAHNYLAQSSGRNVLPPAEMQLKGKRGQYILSPYPHHFLKS
ncbi:hypothetical protein GN956_G7077 [Arapaima gigas]